MHEVRILKPNEAGDLVLVNTISAEDLQRDSAKRRAGESKKFTLKVENNDGEIVKQFNREKWK